MTKKLLLLRHAQSAGRQGTQPDYARNLTVQGKVLATNLGICLAEHQLHPDFILSSSATRARQTVECINNSVHIDSLRLHFLNELYEGPAAAWINHVHQLPASVNCALLVGHNPALSQLATTFADSTIDLPAGGLIAFGFSAEGWGEVSGKGKELTRIMNRT